MYVQEIVFSEMRNNNPKYDCDCTKIKEYEAGNQGDMPYRTAKIKCLKKNNTLHIWGRGGCGRRRRNSRRIRASIRRVMAVRGSSTRARTNHGMTGVRGIVLPGGVWVMIMTAVILTPYLCYA